MLMMFAVIGLILCLLGCIEVMVWCGIELGKVPARVIEEIERRNNVMDKL